MMGRFVVCRLLPPVYSCCSVLTQHTNMHTITCSHAAVKVVLPSRWVSHSIAPILPPICWVIQLQAACCATRHASWPRVCLVCCCVCQVVTNFCAHALGIMTVDSRYHFQQHCCFPEPKGVLSLKGFKA